MDGHERSHGDAAGLMNEYSGNAPRGMIPSSLMSAVTEELVSRVAKNLPRKRSNLSSTTLSPAPKGELEAFSDALISSDPGKAGEFFDRLRASGQTPDALALSWIAEAARLLGNRWVADSCSFLEVTLGLSRLHGLQRSLRGEFMPASMYQPPEMSALFSPVPGETHLLGATIAADFFRRAGWRVDLNYEPDLDVLLERARTGGYSLIGLSAGCLSVRDALKTTVQRLRAAHPDVKIVLGGFITELDPNIKEQISVDHVFSEGVTAPLVCQNLVFPKNEIGGGIDR